MSLEGPHPPDHPPHFSQHAVSYNSMGLDPVQHGSPRNADIIEDLTRAAQCSSPTYAKGTLNFPCLEPVNLSFPQPNFQTDKANTADFQQTLNPENARSSIDLMTTVPSSQTKPHQSVIQQSCSPATERSTSRPSTDAGGTNGAIAQDKASIPSIALIPPKVRDEQTNISSSLPELKTVETIRRCSGLTDEEVDELGGWAVTKELPEFVRMWEKYSVAVKRMRDRAKKSMARVLNSKELCPLGRTIFNYQSLNGNGLAQNFAAGVALPPDQVASTPITHETQKSVRPIKIPSLPKSKSLEMIIYYSGLTNEEVDELGWAVLGELAVFVRLCEKISAAVERMGVRAKDNMAKILDSEETRPLSIAIYNYQDLNGVGLAQNFGAIAPTPMNDQLTVSGMFSAAYCEDMHAYGNP